MRIKEFTRFWAHWEIPPSLKAYTPNKLNAAFLLNYTYSVTLTMW